MTTQLDRHAVSGMVRRPRRRHAVPVHMQLNSDTSALRPVALRGAAPLAGSSPSLKR